MNVRYKAWIVLGNHGRPAEDNVGRQAPIFFNREHADALAAYYNRSAYRRLAQPYRVEPVIVEVGAADIPGGRVVATTQDLIHRVATALTRAGEVNLARDVAALLDTPPGEPAPAPDPGEPEPAVKLTGFQPAPTVGQEGINPPISGSNVAPPTAGPAGPKKRAPARPPAKRSSKTGPPAGKKPKGPPRRKVKTGLFGKDKG